MAITLDNTFQGRVQAYAGAINGNDQPVSVTVTEANSVLIVGTTGIPSALAFNGVALTLIASNNSGSINSSVWILANPPVGTFSLVATRPSQYGDYLIQASVWKAATYSNFTQAINGYWASGTTTSITVPTGGLAIAYMMSLHGDGSAGGFVDTPIAPQTLLAQQDAAQHLTSSYKSVDGATTLGYTWAEAGTQGVSMLVVALAPAVTDTAAPTFTGTLTVTPSSTTATVDWSSTTHTDNVGITSYDWALDNATWTNVGTALNVGLTGLTAATNYTVYVRANDAAGNHTVLSQTFATTAATTGDTTAPVMQGSLAVSAITKTTATVTWQAATDVGSGVQGYQISVDTGVANWQTVPGGAGVTSFSITGLTELTSYTVRVRAFDGTPNYATALTASLRTIGASFTFDTMENNTTTIWKNQAVVWNWWVGGRIGSLKAITPQEGTGTIDANGVLVITAVLPTGAGLGLVAKQNTSATDDAVFLQAGTAT